MEQSILTALRSAIQERGLTITELAKAAKVNRTTLSLMLSGVKSPTLRTLCRVCGVLNLTIKIETMKFTQKDYEAAVEEAAKAWKEEERVRSLCMSGLAKESEVDKAYEAAQKASEHTQYVYQNLE